MRSFSSFTVSCELVNHQLIQYGVTAPLIMDRGHTGHGSTAQWVTWVMGHSE